MTVLTERILPSSDSVSSDEHPFRYLDIDGEAWLRRTRGEIAALALLGTFMGVLFGPSFGIIQFGPMRPASARRLVSSRCSVGRLASLSANTPALRQTSPMVETNGQTEAPWHVKAPG
jgi:hypothetical protein